MMVRLLVVFALLLGGCGLRGSAPAVAPAAGTGEAQASARAAEQALTVLEPQVPQASRHLVELIRGNLEAIARSLTEVQDGLRAAARERDELRTQRDRALEEADGWRAAWLGGRGQAWLTTALALVAIGVILRLIALFVLSGFGAIISRLGSLILCVSILGAPLCWLFDEAWLWKKGRKS